MKVISAHVLIKDKEGKILLTQRADLPLWVLPGGHVNKKEIPIQTAIREVKEEIGLKITIDKLLVKYKTSYGKYKYIYSGKVTGGILGSSNEVRKIGWYKLNSLPSPITLYEKQRIRDSSSNIVLEKDDVFLKTKEIINMLKHPLHFCYIIVIILKLKYQGKDNFKFKLEQ